MKSIICTGESVRGILEDRKKQTRRVINPQPDSIRKSPFVKSGIETCHGYEIKCPYGLCDKLYVKEAWRIVGWDCENGDWKIEYKDGSNSGWLQPETSEEWDTDNLIQCTDECLNAGIPEDENGRFQFSEEHPCPTKWRSPLFMPRWASRITLEIVGIRVERVQGISDIDALNEGISVLDQKWTFKNFPDYFELYSYWKEIFPGSKPPLGPSPREKYAKYWDSINAKRGYPWDSNPYVWVLEFERVES